MNEQTQYISKYRIDQLKKSSSKRSRLFHHNHIGHIKNQLDSIIFHHLFMDQIMAEVLECFMTKTSRFTSGDSESNKFQIKIDILESLNILHPNVVHTLRNLNRKRNMIAHNLNYKLNRKDMEELTKYLEFKKTVPLYKQLHITLTNTTKSLLHTLSIIKTAPASALLFSNYSVIKNDVLIKQYLTGDLRSEFKKIITSLTT